MEAKDAAMTNDAALYNSAVAKHAAWLMCNDASKDMPTEAEMTNNIPTEANTEAKDAERTNDAVSYNSAVANHADWLMHNGATNDMPTEAERTNNMPTEAKDAMPTEADDAMHEYAVMKHVMTKNANAPAKNTNAVSLTDAAAPADAIPCNDVDSNFTVDDVPLPTPTEADDTVPKTDLNAADVLLIMKPP